MSLLLVEYIWSFRGALFIHISIYIYGSRLGYVIGLLLCMSTAPDQVGYDLPHPKCPDSPTDLGAPPKRNCPDPTDIMGILDQNLSGRPNQPRHLYSGVLLTDGMPPRGGSHRDIGPPPNFSFAISVPHMCGVLWASVNTGTVLVAVFRRVRSIPLRP